MSSGKLRAPFPYAGYKGKVSEVVWERFGKVTNYVEPFFGSGAVLLQRPGHVTREVINDKSGNIVNFWRSVKHDPDAVTEHAVTLFSESELHARNSYCRRNLDELTARLEGCPEYYDAKLAGYWCYVQCMAIGEAAYADGPWVEEDGKLVCRPKSRGVRRAVPCDQRRGVQKSIPVHGKQGAMSRSDHVRSDMRKLHDRIKDAHIICGNWNRVCTPTYTTQHGLTGVYMDPPYATDCKMYKNSEPLLDQICAWMLENGNNPKLRIALSYYDGTLPVEFPDTWSVHEWKAGGGRVTIGGASDENRSKERIIFSPGCLRPIGVQLDMFA